MTGYPMRRPYLDQLRDAAQASERAEAEFRRFAERRLETMSAERVRAYRRCQLVSDMIQTALPRPEPEECVAAQIGCVLSQAGWAGGDTGYDEVREQLGRVAELVHADLHGEPGVVSSTVVAALEAFESWYRERFGTEFPALQPSAVNAFQPLVDF
jgi:hypothetical protein